MIMALGEILEKDHVVSPPAVSLRSTPGTCSGNTLCTLFEGSLRVMCFVSEWLPNNID